MNQTHIYRGLPVSTEGREEGQDKGKGLSYKLFCIK